MSRLRPPKKQGKHSPARGSVLVKPLLLKCVAPAGTALRAINHGLPVKLPFSAPSKRAVTDRTHLCR